MLLFYHRDYLTKACQAKVGEWGLGRCDIRKTTEFLVIPRAAHCHFWVVPGSDIYWQKGQQHFNFSPATTAVIGDKPPTIEGGLVTLM